MLPGLDPGDQGRQGVEPLLLLGLPGGPIPDLQPIPGPDHHDLAPEPSEFQLVPRRFSAEIGVMTGLVGMAGGMGGFYLASSLGFAKQWSGSFAPGFYIFAGLAVAALVALMFVKNQWRATWGAADGVRI